MDSHKLLKISLVLSVVALVYFITLVGLTTIEIESSSAIVVIRFFGELLTIPLLLFVVVALGFSIFRMIKNRERKGFFLVFLINMLTVCLLLWATFST